MWNNKTKNIIKIPRKVFVIIFYWMIHIKFFIILIILVWKSITINIYIPDDGYQLNEADKIIDQYSIKYKSINIYINQDVYSLDIKRDIILRIPADTDVSIIGKSPSGTIIDFTDSFFNFNIYFIEYTNQYLKFENITFYNFYHPRVSDSSNILYLYTTNINFNIIIKNCKFFKSNSVIFKMDTNYFSYTGDIKYPIQFISCKFRYLKVYIL